MTEEEFDKEFNLIDSPTGETYWEWDDVKSQDIQNIWSAIEGDDGGIILIPGIHRINTFGYIVTKQIWHFDTKVHWYNPGETRR